MEEYELKDSEAVEKVRETGGSRMIIGDILCLFIAYINFPPFPFAWSSQPEIEEAGKVLHQGGIFHHDNKNNLGISNSLLFQSRDPLNHIARFRE